MPFHPATVHFPIALLALSVFADWVGHIRSNDSLTATGWWALLTAAMGAILAVITGLIDRTRPSIGASIYGVVNRHMYVGIAVLILISALTLWRWRTFASKNRPGWAYLVVSAAVLGLTLYQGWLGGELVYVYGAG
jgi:uncharacterized membrane protein